jgi:hypothetical protein
MSRRSEIFSMLLVIVVFHGVCGRRSIHAQDELRNLATSQMIAYNLRSIDELKRFHLRLDCEVLPTPDSSREYQSRIQMEKLSDEENKLEWTRIDRDSVSEFDLDLKTSPGEVRCQHEVIRKDQKYFLNLITGGWVVTDKLEAKTNCVVHDVFGWPFLSRQIFFSHIDQPRRDFSKWNCTDATRTDTGLEAKWESSNKKSVLIQYTTFRDDVPVYYKGISFQGRVSDPKTDRRKFRVTVELKTEWKKFDNHLLPIRVAGVLNEADEIVMIDAKFDWKLGKDVPSDLVENLLKIADKTTAKAPSFQKDKKSGSSE